MEKEKLKLIFCGDLALSLDRLANIVSLSEPIPSSENRSGLLSPSSPPSISVRKKEFGMLLKLANKI